MSNESLYVPLRRLPLRARVAAAATRQLLRCFIAAAYRPAGAAPFWRRFGLVDFWWGR